MCTAGCAQHWALTSKQSDSYDVDLLDNQKLTSASNTAISYCLFKLSIMSLKRVQTDIASLEKLKFLE